MNLDLLKFALEDSWNRDTCYPFVSWDSSNPSVGQDEVTSLVVNDFLGGEIIKSIDEDGIHYYNLVGEEPLDFTNQTSLVKWDIVSRKELLKNRNTALRYFILSECVKDSMQNNSKVKEKVYKI